MHAPPSMRMVQRLAWALGVTPDDLLSEPRQPSESSQDVPQPADPLTRRVAQAAQLLWSHHGFLRLHLGTGRRRVAGLVAQLPDRLEHDPEEVHARRMEAISLVIRLAAEQLQEAADTLHRLMAQQGA